MMAPDPLDNNRNWIRAAMGLKHLKEGLESFVDDEIVKLQSCLLQNIRSSHGLQPTATCSLCKLENVLPCPTKGYCYKNNGVCNIHTPGVVYPYCQNNVCNNLAATIVDQHRYTRRATSGIALNSVAPSWRNTDVSKWCTSPWEIAKCFMAASGYADKLAVTETDCPGILSVIINCQAIQSALSTIIDPPNDIFFKMRDVRNTIMHSATLEVTDNELQQYIDDMLAILNDSKTIQNHPDAMTARTKLNEIKTNTCVISSKDELELRKKAVKDIEQKQKELLDQCQKLQNDIQTKVNQTVTSINQAKINCQTKQDDLEEKQTYLKSKIDQATASFTRAELKSKEKQESLQKKVDEANTYIARAELKSQQKQESLQSKVDEAITSFAQAELKSQKKQQSLQSKVEESLTTFTQAELKSQQDQTMLHSKVDEAITSFAQAEIESQERQKDLQSKYDQTMISLAQVEIQFQQKQDDMQFSQLNLTLTSLQEQMKQMLEDLLQCQLDIKVRSDLQKGTDKHEKHVKILEKRKRHMLIFA